MGHDRDALLRGVDLAALLDELSGQHAGIRNPRWRCPDAAHPDEHPSVTVRVDERGIARWRCWSGGHGGTAIDALMASKGVSVREALDELARRVGGIASVPPGSAHRPAGGPSIGSRPVEAVRVHVERCAELLWSGQGRPVLEWLTEERGIPREVLAANLVGADPGPRRLERPPGLPRRGVAAIFPTLGVDGEVEYFQARYLKPRPGGCRYENPAASMAANPRVGWVKTPAVTRRGVLVVTEGMPDAYTAAAAGFSVVGVLGASSPDPTVADLLCRRRGDRRLVLAFDHGNRPGTGNERLRELLAERDVDAAVLEVPAAVGDLNGWATHDPTWARHLLQHHATPAPEGPTLVR